MPAESEIVHLLPCKIAINWGYPSVEIWYRTLIRFTAMEREYSARYLYMDTSPFLHRMGLNEPMSKS